MANLDLVDQQVEKRMEEMLERMSRMMDKKLDKVYEELRAVGERVEEQRVEEQRVEQQQPQDVSDDASDASDVSDDIYSTRHFKYETVWATMEDLRKESFWTDELRQRLWLAMFHDQANRDVMIPGLWSVLVMAVPFQRFVRAVHDQEREHALSDPNLSEVEKEVYRNPPDGNFFGIIHEILKMASISKITTFDADDKLVAARVFRLAKIELMDDELKE